MIIDRLNKSDFSRNQTSRLLMGSYLREIYFFATIFRWVKTQSKNIIRSDVFKNAKTECHCSPTEMFLRVNRYNQLCKRCLRGLSDCAPCSLRTTMYSVVRIMSLGKSYYLDYAYSLTRGFFAYTNARDENNYLLLMFSLYSRVFIVHIVIIYLIKVWFIQSSYKYLIKNTWHSARRVCLQK